MLENHPSCASPMRHVQEKGEIQKTTNWQERNTKNYKRAGENTKKTLPEYREIQKTTHGQERIQKNIT